ncbi:pantoate--beta-alanine ligase [Metabacillus litoralis]|jgi:pantoate--beta-alanine ligase|uniref:pantoate--beta-alanine ligase n=1 Tax=Metabacillus litoralis TaxID=152268 RepID=UPI00203ACE16|nr:pantoate--beta-alanine ligase [Metabacillus litoralis]MCM3652091.1 pantoate--beta-alanine ligase [Metabacillus litoralis]
MIVITTKNELVQKISEIKNDNKTIGFVPTMGFLHDGHVKLLEEARKANDFVVLSIFVNPLQFGPNEDFDSYPRNARKDEEIAKLAGVDLIFTPSVLEMYPKKPTYTVTVGSRVDVLCGRSREGHFDGVATVLTKLFNLIEPNRAYFGMKDAQQVAVVDGLITEFNYPIDLVTVPTVREEDGLAKSSRNVYLSEIERSQAIVIYKSLVMAKQKINQGMRDKEEIKSFISSLISNESDGIIDYVEILSYPELDEIEIMNGKIILAIAVKFTKARLIDNITFEVE